ncbi:uncharacterized protein LOC108840470 isoform X2 [Raphanus sativus]|uniref:Uncharacterized protein LOC108840470 isoform X2 n=1 Tax=Raphanus sativus TaxID=3726 RepID=A0A6J0M8V0_RAPSA|nr:uncharacterized protein LOC108840470 isoform X2 [Raphanus sativus]
MEENVEQEETSFSSLFSCFIALSTLILIYSPIIHLSPVLLISGALLLSLLHLGSTTTREPVTRPGKSKEGESKTEETTEEEEEEEEEEESDVLFDVCSLSERDKQDSDRSHEFVEWDLRAPLEVIHEAYEEDEEENPTRFREIERYPSLSLCYPETDSGSDSDSSSEFTFPEMSSWMSPEKMGYRWEEEEEEDDGAAGLIEIKLHDEYKKKKRKQNQTELDFHAEEEVP